jgi:hypothetical protein
VESSTSAEGLVAVPILVSFENYPAASHLSDTIVIFITELDYLTVQSEPYPAYVEDFQDPSILQSIGCSSVFQKAEAKVHATLSNGNSTEITEYATFSSSNTGVVTTDGNILTGVAVGTVEITASYDEIESEPYDMTVANSAIQIVSIEENTLTDDTFNEVLGTTQLLNLEVTLSDGTVYPDALSLDWLNLAEILDFSSDSPAIVVNSAGEIELVSNYHTWVTITIATTCDPSVVNTARIKPNLKPDTWDGDVDLEMVDADGFQFDGVSTGDEFEIKLMVNANEGFLLSFSLLVYYDPAVFEVISCYQSGVWADNNGKKIKTVCLARFI